MTKYKALKFVCLGILLLLLGIPSLAQNTKGDRPVPQNRETRFKTPKKSKQTRQPARKVRRGDDKPDQRFSIPPRKDRAVERPGKPVKPTYSRSKPQKTQKPWKGDITGRRIKPRSSSSRAKNVYPQPESINYSSRNLKRSVRDNSNPNIARVRRMQRQSSSEPRVGKPIRPTFHKTKPQGSDRAWQGDITGRKIRAGSQRMRKPAEAPDPRMMGSSVPRSKRGGVVPSRVSGKARNVSSGKSFYTNNQSRKPPSFQSDRSRVALNMYGRHGQPRAEGKGSGKVVPRSASASYLARRSTNTWAHFPRPKRKQERAYTRDIAGKKLRSKNYETPRPLLANPTLNYKRRVASGERPYKGRTSGYDTRTQSGRAWRGDIAHRAIRGGFRSKKGEPQPGIPLVGKGPGIGAKGIGNYKGNINAGRRGFGNQGEEYTGNIRSRRSLKGGGSVTGGWNNKGQPVQGRTPGKGIDGVGYSGNIRAGRRGFSDQGEEYSGNIRSGKLLKGGGSITGGWNNKGQPIEGRTPGRGSEGVGYSGNIRAGKRGFSDQGEEYTGNIRSRRALKGGGSITGGWNNKGQPIEGRTPGRGSEGVGYPGNIRAGKRGFSDQGEEYSGNIRVRRGFNDQGEEYTGNIRARRPDKGGGSISGRTWNNQGRPIEGRAYAGQTKISRYSGNVRTARPIKGGGSVSGKLWNNNEKPINVRTPEDSEERGFSGNIKMARGDYKRNPNSAKDALPGLKASAANIKAGQSVRGVKQSWNYIKNPSSADDAQRTREPGRAFGQSVDYQGNIRIKKFDLFSKSDLHPDAKFVKLNKNNVAEEKDLLTNFKLWWARLFRKAETQPDHLKEKDNDRKPRYDKGEAGLWYD